MYIQSSLQQGEDTRLTSRGKIPVPSGRRRRHNQIPAGCSVSTGIYSIHSLLYCPPQTRTPRNNGCPTKQSQRHINLGVSSAKYAPFSQGTRACIGRHLAQLELQIALVSIMWRATNATASYDRRNDGGRARGAGIGRTNAQKFQLYDQIISKNKAGHSISAAWAHTAEDKPSRLFRRIQGAI